MPHAACAFSSPCPCPCLLASAFGGAAAPSAPPRLCGKTRISAFPRPTGKCVLGLAATPPSVVLSRSLKCADARQHEPRGCPGAKRFPDHGPRTAAQRPDGGEAARLFLSCLWRRSRPLCASAPHAFHSKFNIHHSKLGGAAASAPPRLCGKTRISPSLPRREAPPRPRTKDGRAAARRRRSRQTPRPMHSIQNSTFIIQNSTFKIWRPRRPLTGRLTKPACRRRIALRPPAASH